MNLNTKWKGLKALIEDRAEAKSRSTEALQGDFKRLQLLITGAPRSGTTWFLHMFQTPGILTFNEPFGPKYTALWSKKNLEGKGIDQQGLHQHWQSLANGKDWGHFRKKDFTHSPSPVRPWFHQRYINKQDYHIVIKDPMLSYGLAESKEALDQVRVLLIFRNPLSIVSSRKRLGWNTNRFIERMRQLNTLRDKLNTKERQALDVPLEQRTAIQTIALHTAITHKMMDLAKEGTELVYFEEASQNPTETFRKIYGNLGLKYGPKEEARHQQLTQNNKKVSNDYAQRHQTARNSKAYTDIYKSRLNEQETEDTVAIYQTFGLAHHYRF